MSQDRRKFLKVVGGAAATTALAGCTGGSFGSGGGSGATIGMANSLTGSLSAFGERNKRGKQLALADVNDVGLRGGELEILVEDTQSKPGPAVSAAQKLVEQNGVPLLVGAVNSSSSLAIYESVVQQTDVVQISQNSTSPDLSKFPELLRISPPGRAQAAALADLISSDGHDSVAVGYVNNAYGEGVSQAFKQAYDGEIPYMQAHAQGQSSYANVVTAMNESGASAWLFVTYQPEFATIASDAFDQGYTDVAVYGADSVKGPEVLKQAPMEFLSGMKAVVPSVAVEQQNYQNFASTFQSEFGKKPTSWAAYAYDAVVTGAIAIQAADEVSGAAIGEVVKDVTRPEGQEATTYKAAHDILADGGGAGDVDYRGVSGPIDLDENGDPAAFLQIFTVKNGEYVATGFIES
ncbi:MAG: ABC transporter substrate-binding protein [Halobaculum sp.]